MALYVVEVVRTSNSDLTKDEFLWVSNTLQDVLDKVDKRVKDGSGLFNKLPFKCINVLLHNVVLANRYDGGNWLV